MCGKWKVNGLGISASYWILYHKGLLRLDSSLLDPVSISKFTEECYILYEKYVICTTMVLDTYVKLEETLVPFKIVVIIILFCCAHKHWFHLRWWMALLIASAMSVVIPLLYWGGRNLLLLTRSFSSVFNLFIVLCATGAFWIEEMASI